MTTNNNGHLLDSSGQVAVDFVWGNFPMQPNDDRAGAVDPANIGGTDGDYSWSATTRVASGRLDPALDSHAIVEAAYSGYPAFVAGVAKYIVTAASGNGTTVTYTATNDFQVGDVVTVTGLSVSALNLASQTVTAANKQSFSVANAASGSVTGAYGTASLSSGASASDGAYVNGTAYIVVPSVLGTTTAVALDLLKDAGYETANITTATAATNTRTNITRFNATSATSAVVYATGAHTNYPTGTKVTIVAGTPAGSSPVNLPAYALGTWTVTGSAGAGQITVSGSGFTVADTTGVNATGTLGGANGTIKTQSTAANAASISTTATITITPWANAS